MELVYVVLACAQGILATVGKLLYKLHEINKLPIYIIYICYFFFSYGLGFITKGVLQLKKNYVMIINIKKYKFYVSTCLLLR